MKSPEEPSDAKQARRLKVVLPAALVLATIMGTGPGIYLVNDGRQILGMPAIYAWAIFWFLV